MSAGRPSVLTRICDRRRADVAADDARRPLDDIQRSLDAARRPHRSLSRSLGLSASHAIAVIAEFKRASPSAGPIYAGANISDVVTAYEKAGAAAVSVLTEPVDFGGSLDDLRMARAATTLPILRKDFMVAPYQFYEAAEAGADIVLLIAAALDAAEINSFARLARSLALEVLLEIHALDELNGIDLSGIDFIGVNNRNLHTLKTDVQLSFDVWDRLPKGLPLISESGLKDAETIARLRKAGYSGFLIGESLMATGRPGPALAELIADAAVLAAGDDG